MISGSLRNAAVTTAKWESMFGIAKDKYKRMRGDSPAWWVDRANYADLGGNGGLAETNHDSNSIAKGANAVHLDGHVGWYEFVSLSPVTTDGCMWTYSGINYVMFPTNTIYLRADGTWKRSASDDIYANGIWQAKYFY